MVKSPNIAVYLIMRIIFQIKIYPKLKMQSIIYLRANILIKKNRNKSDNLVCY